MTKEDNAMLMAPFFVDEFLYALNQILLDKAPSLDGLNPTFYKKILEFIGPTLYSWYCKWLEQCSFLPSLNETISTLICKIASPIALTDFRHILLCNVLYNIILVLTN